MYQERGVPLYWVIDAEEQFVEMWRPVDDLPRIERQTLIWNPAGASDQFELGLAESDVRHGVSPTQPNGTQR